MLKRTADILLSLVLLVFLCPIMLGIALAVRLTMGCPTVFRQARVGHRGRLFTLYKFRTMTDARDESGGFVADCERRTALGEFLRVYSLDELPQLWNVLRGEMSLVGPRPLLPQYVADCDAREACRHNVRPGITGWAQVNGRTRISYRERFELDVWYIENWTNWLDLRIVLLTVIRVLRCDDIATEDSAASGSAASGSGEDSAMP